MNAVRVCLDSDVSHAPGRVPPRLTPVFAIVKINTYTVIGNLQQTGREQLANGYSVVHRTAAQPSLACARLDIVRQCLPDPPGHGMM